MGKDVGSLITSLVVGTIVAIFFVGFLFIYFMFCALSYRVARSMASKGWTVLAYLVFFLPFSISLCSLHPWWLYLAGFAHLITVLGFIQGLSQPTARASLAVVSVIVLSIPLRLSWLEYKYTEEKNRPTERIVEIAERVYKSLGKVSWQVQVTWL